jgi:PHD/YefM family antitoxin component YafN of YafNO toxin-antitoxin module
MAEVQEQYVVDAKGQKVAVLLSLRQYQKLMEDLHDLAIVAERRAEAPVPLRDVKRRLEEDALL